MAVGWLTALKVIPWGDVIEAAPGLAKSARGFFKRTQDAAPPPTDAAATPATGADALTRATQRVAALEARLAQTAERQQAAAELLDSLASQNARMVEAIDALDKRCQALKLWVAIVSIGLIGTLAWVASIAR